MALMREVYQAVRIRARRGDVCGVEGLVKILTRTGSRPDAQIWLQMIYAYGKRGDGDGAKHVLP